MKYLVLIVFIIMSVACSNQFSKNEFNVDKDEYVVAIVNGKEITLKNIRSLYYVEEEDIPVMVEKYIREEVMVQEARKLGINVTGEVENMELLFPYGATGNEEFFELQADYLGITSEEYYQVYFKERVERDAFVNYLINEVLDFSIYEEDDHESVESEIDQYINRLLTEYEIEILL